MHEQNITHSQTKLGDIAPEIYRQLLADHVVGSRPTKRKKNLQCSLIVQCVMCMLKVEKMQVKLLLDG